jgi:hypothetical protein
LSESPRPNPGNESPTKRPRTSGSFENPDTFSSTAPRNDPEYHFGVGKIENSDVFKKPDGRAPRRAGSQNETVTTPQRPGSSSLTGSYTPRRKLSNASSFQKSDKEDGYKFKFLELVKENPHLKLSIERQQYAGAYWYAQKAYPELEVHWSHRLPLRYSEFFSLLGLDVNDKAMGKELPGIMHETLTMGGYDRECYVFLKNTDWLGMFSELSGMLQEPTPVSRGVIVLGARTTPAQ